ncbi:MAG TPA: DUF2950 domain-containing protein [Verrucomicrobiae bacterium]
MKRNRTFNWHPLVLAVLSAGCVAAFARAPREERFNTPDEAIKAFSAAASDKDTNALMVIFGPDMRELISADPVQASNGLAHLSRRVRERVEPVHQSDAFIGLDLGADAWPFPIALVKQDAQWRFDTAGGKDEILNRRIGRDELDTIRVCHAYVDAQREYALRDHTGTGVLEYAQHLRSAEGKHDGLFWHAGPGEEMSPLGPLVAQAHVEGYSHVSKIINEEQAPFHGYYFKVLTRQGAQAPAGKYNYIINGHMIAGFALVAWPAEWGNSGVMTFIINQQGKVYEKNLGPETSNLASNMKIYNPGPGWKLAE